MKMPHLQGWTAFHQEHLCIFIFKWYWRPQICIFFMWHSRYNIQISRKRWR
jgi:hypothetical protein